MMTTISRFTDNELPRASRGSVAGAISGQTEAFCRLAGEVGNEFEILVHVQDGEVCELGSCGDQQVGDGGCPMVASFCKCKLQFDGPVFDLRSQVLDGHR